MEKPKRLIHYNGDDGLFDSVMLSRVSLIEK